LTDRLEALSGHAEAMSKHLQRELTNLNRALLDLAAAAEEAIRTAIVALQQSDTQAARRVIASDVVIDEEENRIDEMCLRALALYQPVAIDLRRIVAMLKINTELERMADLAEDIAERALALAALPPIPAPPLLQKMTDRTAAMVRQSLDAFLNLSAREARSVCQQDDEIDGYNKTIIDDLVNLMRGSPDLVEPGLSYFSAVRHLERIADHATNIAETVIYLVEGEIVRHRLAANRDES
jgi:phosphate transport system protein